MVSRHRFNRNGGWLFIYRWSITNCVHPFGELVSGLLMGTCFVLIAFFIQTNTITTESVLISIPIGILVGAINMSNNIRDIEEDIKGGRKTLVILLGREKAIVTLAVAFFIAYLHRGNCINGLYKPLGISYVPRFEKTNLCRSKFPKRGKRSWYMRIAMKSTAMTNTIFGFLLSAGLLISYLFK